MAAKKEQKGTKVKDVTAEMRETARRVWLAGLGALNAAEEEGSKVFKTLVTKGEEFEKRNRPRMTKTMEGARERMKGAGGKMKDVLGKVGGSFEERVAAVLKRMGVPARDEIARLTRRVEHLSASVEKLQGKKPATRMRLAAKKTTTTARKKKTAAPKKKTSS